jgi:hypothetical protein
MLKFELNEYGFDDILNDIREDLSNVLGKSFSKNEKDNVINRAIGAINALVNICLITEVEPDAESKSNTYS